VTGPLLNISGLAKSFASPDGERSVIVDIPAFALAEGEQVAVRGASGSGKTTFLNLIAGILQPDQGQIIIGGEDLARLSESQRDRLRSRTIGYVFQNFNLLQGYTALENVMLGMMFGPGVDRARSKALLERVGLGHRLNYKPSQLSIGQQQRVAVARALANHPKLVLADEPTGALDSKNASQVLQLIRDLCKEVSAALLLVTHDLNIAAQLERTVVLSEINKAAA